MDKVDINDLYDKVLNYFRSLEGVVENPTPKYLGFAVNKKLIAEVECRRDYVNLHVNSKYISEEDMLGLNAKVVPDTYKWILNTQVKIYGEENIQRYFNIVRKCYEGTKKEYEDKLSEAIQETIADNEEYIQKYMNMAEYAFEKLIYKWKEFITYEISNNSLDQLKSDIESLSTFSSGDFLSQYKNEEDKHNFLTLLYQVVAYVDKNAYNKVVYNEYEDKRTLALTFVRQNEWVKSLINYKKYKDLTKVPEVVRNVIMYILSPENKLSGFKSFKLMQFLKLLKPESKLETHYERLCAGIFKALESYNIQVVNEANRGVVYAHIMFSKEMVKLWNVENNFFKVQPFKGIDISRETIQENLNKDVMIFKDNKLKSDDSVKNFFYAVDESNVLFLGAFIGEAKEENGLFYREFIRLRATEKQVVSLPQDKNWGGKFSSKRIIAVKEEDKEDFENAVLNNIFETDLDSILEEIKLYKPREAVQPQGKEDEEDTDDEVEVVEDEKFEKEIETPLNMILYGPPGTGKTYNTVNYAVSIVEKKEIEEVILEAKKDREAVFNRYKEYLAEKKIVFTTFHQNYSYEDFIQGIRANTNNTDQLSFVKQDGIFKDLVERAKNDLSNYYVIIIDEINRGNISRIFGELITLIEDDKRQGEPNEMSVTLPSKELFVVPPNLFILGTMNTADRSIANIDIALRRRFDFIPMYPDYSLIPQFQHILSPINRGIYEKKRSADYLIGHAFFVNKTMEDLKNIVDKKIIPLLNEYFYLNTQDVIDILNRGGIKVKENFDTFQLEFDGIEE